METAYPPATVPRMGTMPLLVILAVWALIGVVASIVMGRRGHSAFTWLILGAVLGPLVVPLAFTSSHAARRDPLANARPLRKGTVGLGKVDVLVGIDGSVESAAALRAAINLIGDRLGRLTLAGVIDYDSATTGRPWGSERLATEELDRAAASIGLIEPATVLLVGHPATALMKHAAEDGYELLVVGRRGHGASKTLLGSTATSLAHGAGIPILVV